MSLRLRYLPVVFLLIFTGCSRQPEQQERTRIMLGTVVTIRAYDGKGGNAYPSIDAAFRDMSRIDSLCGYLESSEVSKINRAGDKPVRVSQEVLRIIDKSIHYSELSQGALDITVDPLSRLWNRFEGDELLIPAAKSLDSAKALVDYRALVVTDSSARLLMRGASIDLGALAKGYAVDRGVSVLESLGAAGGLIDAGGDIRTFGTKPDGTLWRIGLKNPRAPDSILRVFEMGGRSVATSGDYERYFMKDGIRYHHILDPETGFPARRCCSVTVITALACDADAIATAVFVMGPVRGMELVESLPDVEALIVVCEDDGTRRILRSTGMSTYEKL